MRRLKPMIPRIRKELKSIPLDDIFSQKRGDEQESNENMPKDEKSLKETLACSCGTLMLGAKPGWECPTCGFQKEEAEK